MRAMRSSSAARSISANPPSSRNDQPGLSTGRHDVAVAARRRDRLVARAVVLGEPDGADPGHDGLLRALVQTLAATAHGREELVQVRLERGEDPVGPVLHLEPRLARLAPGLVDDLLCLTLRELDDL